MPAPNVLRAKQREELKPLIGELQRLLMGESYKDIAARSGITHYQVGRILGESLPAPTYLDITRLIREAGLTPNEAATIVGLYDDSSEEDEENQVFLSLSERRILTLLRKSKLDETQRRLLEQVVEATVLGLERHALLEASGDARPSTASGRKDEVLVPAVATASRRRSHGS